MSVTPMLLALAPLLQDASAAPVRSAELGPRIELRRAGSTVDVTIDGAPFTVVHAGATPRPYLFPVLGPGGTPMTRAWPMEEVEGEARDHPHHQSLWFTHGAVNGHDFWHGRGAGEGIELERIVELRSGEEAAVLRASYRWVAQGAVQCREERTLRFFAREGARGVDFDVTLVPVGKPLTMGDTKEGSMAVRSIPALRLAGERAAGRARNSAGDGGTAVWGKRAQWITYWAPVGGRVVGYAMFDHPENPRHPTWWHARDYGLCAANPFGVHDFEEKPAGTGDLTVPLGETLRLRYRVLFYEGELDDAALARAFAEFAGA